MKFSSVIIFGEALVDLFKTGLVVGGAPFNVARHLAGFGFNSLFISAIGQDNVGMLIKQEISKFRMYEGGVQTLEYKPTGSVHIHENERGHTFEIKKQVAYDYIQSEAVCKSIDQYFVDAELPLNKNSFFYHGTLALRNDVSYKAYRDVAEKIKPSNTTSYMDINWREGFVESKLALSLILHSDIVKASIEELQMMLDWQSLAHVEEKSLPKIGTLTPQVARALENSKVKLLLVTYGELGSAIFNSKGECLSVAKSAECKSLVDTVGAGDAFSSVILLAFTQGWSLDLSLIRANEFASAVCGIRGAIPSDLSFYNQFTKKWGLVDAVLV